MIESLENPMIDFYRYPPIGGDDWQYAFETAQARAMETQMLSRSTLADMANAAGFPQAVEYLRSTEYALPDSAGIAELEHILSACRSGLRRQFADWMHNEKILALFKARDDFANLRLAVRRFIAKKPIGNDYSVDGNFPPEGFAEVFQSERYELLPDYMAQAAEQAIIEYYSDKNIRRIDYAIDYQQAKFNLDTAAELKNEFLLALFRIQSDLANIRTMLRLKLATELSNAGSAETNHEVFLPGGYVQLDKLLRGQETSGEGLATLFFATPYFELIQAGAAYAASEKSFLKIEQQCDEYLAGFLQSTISIVVGPQPVIAYFLLKENEIRMVRLVLTAKKNDLNPKMILDRIP